MSPKHWPGHGVVVGAAVPVGFERGDLWLSGQFGVDQRLQLCEGMAEPVLEDGCEDPVSCTCRRDHLVRGDHRFCHRFLANYVVPGLQCANGDGGVHPLLHCPGRRPYAHGSRLAARGSRRGVVRQYRRRGSRRCASCECAESGGRGLRAEREFHDGESMCLRHRRLGAVAHVVRQSVEVGQGCVAAIDMFAACFVGQEEVVGAVSSGDINVLAQLDRALGAEQGKPPVTPGWQGVWRIPVDADVAVAVGIAEHDFAEVFELRVRRIGVVYRRGCRRTDRVGKTSPGGSRR